MNAEIRALIDRLELVPHPEGGFYRETWRSPTVFSQASLPQGYPGPRSASTSIYFLLPAETCSRLHRVRSDEIWLHHQGDDLALRIGATPELARDPAREQRLGQGRDASLQAFVPAGEWQEAYAMPGAAGYALVGCVVAPGFDFADFEMEEEPNP